MNKAVREIVEDLRNADRLGTPIDAGAIADRIELAFAELEEKWRQRVKDVLPSPTSSRARSITC